MYFYIELFLVIMYHLNKREDIFRVEGKPQIFLIQHNLKNQNVTTNSNTSKFFIKNFHFLLFINCKASDTIFRTIKKRKADILN